ncbi:unnamed protein product [Toxocara canis]|uniref:Uncharacterized protein n=1 Tax=Toxocara canis TaxID=6265 RepID=A0A183V4W0_TOXCA|nr:unnamed protein product [Toxocara canis]
MAETPIRNGGQGGTVIDKRGRGSDVCWREGSCVICPPAELSSTRFVVKVPRSGMELLNDKSGNAERGK